MCCSGSWRSWPGSAMPSMGASWRSSPRSIATGCGVPPGHGRWRVGGLEVGRLGGQCQDDHHRRAAQCGLSPLRGPVAAGPAVAGSGRGHRRPRRRGSDEHYAQLASVATVNQLRTAIGSNPPRPRPHPQPQASITKNTDEHFTWWRIKLPHAQAATLDAAINAHREALITDWNQARAGDTLAGRTADARGPRGLPAPNRGRLGHRSHPPPARCAHHRGGAPRPRTARRRPAPGTTADRRRSALPDL